MATTTVPMDDKALFEQAISNEPIAEAQPEAQPEPPAADTSGEQPRDAQGRFAAVEQQPEPAAPVQEQPPAQTEQEASVPSWRLKELREARDAERTAREAAERRAAEAEARWQALQRQQPPAQQPEPPDMFANPQGWQEFLLTQQRQQASSQRYEFSEMMARQHFGDARVDEAEKWAGQNLGPAERARIANAKHPYAELIRMQDERKVLSEIGTDPNAYVQKKLDEALKNPEFLAKALAAAQAQASGQAPGAKPNNLVQLPPSLNRQASAASPHEEQGDMSDRSLYAFATR